MQILIPISTRSDFFPETEYFFPKPLVEIFGEPMISLVLKNLTQSLCESRFIFAINKADNRQFSIENILTFSTDRPVHVIEKEEETSGALCSCLLAIDHLDWDLPLVISNSDQIIDHDLGKIILHFDVNAFDGGLITFDSSHPRWSYAVLAGDGSVVQTYEKLVKSKDAIAGFYYFKKASLFIEAAKKVIINGNSYSGNYFISSVINEVILNGGRIGSYKINSSNYQSLYSPSKIDDFIVSSYAKKLTRQKLFHSLNVLIPAAGDGSRFKNAGWLRPKPFIDVNGKPMIRRVYQNFVPDYATSIAIVKQHHLDTFAGSTNNDLVDFDHVVPIDKTTEGTACTLLLARTYINNDSAMLVVNSDQLVDFDVEDFVDDCRLRGLDGSILVFRDPSMNPKWSFARLDENDLVIEVAEKKPISDLATVGVYLFSRGREFVDSAIEMILHNDRVNGEFYTCPVYNYMISKGARIGIYEVSCDSMKGLGTPDDLNHYLRSIASLPSSDRPGSE